MGYHQAMTSSSTPLKNHLAIISTISTSLGHGHRFFYETLRMFSILKIADIISIYQTKISKFNLMKAGKNVRYSTINTQSYHFSPNHFVSTIHHYLDIYESQVAASMQRLQSSFNRNINSVASQRFHPRWRRQETSYRQITSRTRVSTQHIEHYSQSGRQYVGNTTNASVNVCTEPTESRRQNYRCSSCLKKQVSHKRLEDKTQKKDEVRRQRERNPVENTESLPSKPCEKKKKAKAPKERKEDQSNELNPNPTTKKECYRKEPSSPARQKEFDPAVKRGQQKREFGRTFKNGKQLNQSNSASVKLEKEHDLFQQTRAKIQLLETQNFFLKKKIQKIQQLQKQASASSSLKSEVQSQKYSSKVDTKPIIIIIPREDSLQDLLLRIARDDNQSIIRQNNMRGD